MNLFSKRKAESPDLPLRVATLEAEVAKVSASMRALELEQATMHEQVMRRMRRAVAAERNQERDADRDDAQPVPPVHAAPRVLTGVRARRLSRLMRGDPLAETDTNGAAEG